MSQPALRLQYFRCWQEDGTLLAIHNELYVLSRLVEGRSDSLSELMVNSQSVKTATIDSLISNAFCTVTCI